MNAERLRAVVEAVLLDIGNTGLVDGLQRVIDSLNNVINAPNEAHSKQLTDALDALNSQLDQSQSDQFPKTWYPVLETIDIPKNFGRDLKSQISSIIAGNQITSAHARDQIIEIQTSLKEYVEAANKMSEAFDYFGVDAAEQVKGQGELSLLVPEAAIKGELLQLADELKFFDQMVRFFTEVETSGREPTKIRQISTTDPFIAVTSVLGAVLITLKIVREIQKIIEGTHKIKVARAAAVDAEMDKATLDRFDKKIGDYISKQLDDLLDSVIKTAKENVKGRTAELTNEGKKILEGMARRIDKGYQFDGDAQEDKEAPDTDAGIVAEIRSVAEEIRHVEPPSEETLNLAAPEGAEAGHDENADK